MHFWLNSVYDCRKYITGIPRKTTALFIENVFAANNGKIKILIPKEIKKKIFE